MYQGRRTEDLPSLKGGQVITRQPTAAESAFRNEALLKAAVEKVSSANQPTESEKEEPKWKMPHITHSRQIKQPIQMTIPGTNLSPQVRQSQADTEASALANYMAQRAPGRSLGSQLQRAMANASVRQPDLF
jgi:hypothetical protein